MRMLVENFMQMIGWFELMRSCFLVFHTFSITNLKFVLLKIVASFFIRQLCAEV